MPKEDLLAQVAKLLGAATTTVECDEEEPSTTGNANADEWCAAPPTERRVPLPRASAPLTPLAASRAPPPADRDAITGSEVNAEGRGDAREVSMGVGGVAGVISGLGTAGSGVSRVSSIYLPKLASEADLPILATADHLPSLATDAASSSPARDENVLSSQENKPAPRGRQLARPEVAREQASSARPPTGASRGCSSPNQLRPHGRARDQASSARPPLAHAGGASRGCSCTSAVPGGAPHQCGYPSGQTPALPKENGIEDGRDQAQMGSESSPARFVPPSSASRSMEKPFSFAFKANFCNCGAPGCGSGETGPRQPTRPITAPGLTASGARPALKRPDSASPAAISANSAWRLFPRLAKDEEFVDFRLWTGAFGQHEAALGLDQDLTFTTPRLRYYLTELR